MGAPVNLYLVPYPGVSGGVDEAGGTRRTDSRRQASDDLRRAVEARIDLRGAVEVRVNLMGVAETWVDLRVAAETRVDL